MSERDALMHAICANPDDDTPRLVFADWLQENGDDARAEFIRGQIESATASRGPRKDALLAREKELLAAHAEVWQEPVAAFVDSYFGVGVEFRRGFVEAIGAEPETFVERGADLFALAPIREVWFGELEDYAELAGCKHLLRLHTLDLTGSGLSEHFDPAPLLQSRYLANLTTLILGGHDDNGHLDIAGVRALVAAKYLGKVETLSLSGNWLNQFDPNTFATFLTAKNLPSLRNLDLAQAGIGDDGTVALATTPWVAQLKVLNLVQNGISDWGCRALLRSPQLNGLETLDLRRNITELRDNSSPMLTELRDRANPMTPETANLLRERFGARVLL